LAAYLGAAPSIALATIGLTIAHDGQAYAAIEARSMMLGEHSEPDSIAAQAYGKTEISERHRHRYEFNREYEAILTGGGLRLTDTTPDSTYVQIVEIPTHPFFLGCQFHPEFKSKPLEPHPLFRDFIAASYHHRLANTQQQSEAIRSSSV
jgi:CTP synthase